MKKWMVISASVVFVIGCAEGQPTGTRLAYDKIVGVYFGNEPSAVAPFTQWFGRPVGGILAYGNNDSNWGAFDSSIPYDVALWSRANRRVLWSIPLIVKEATLEQAAAGKYNGHYKQAAKTINAFRPEDTDVYIRTGWEFNGNWMPWSAAEKAAAFIGAYRRFVETFRSVSPRFKFEWTPAIGNNGMNPEDAYREMTLSILLVWMYITTKLGTRLMARKHLSTKGPSNMDCSGTRISLLLIKNPWRSLNGA